MVVVDRFPPREERQAPMTTPKARTLNGLHEALIARLPALDPMTRVLDLGCGEGAWLARLRDKGFAHLIGVDRDRAPDPLPGVEIYHIDLETVELADPLAPSAFDLITSIEVIEHIANLGRFLTLLAGVLAPRGRILLTTPNTASLMTRLRLCATGRLRQFDQHGDQTHVTPIFLDPFRRLLLRHGLAITELWTYPEGAAIHGSRRLSRLTASLLGLLLPDPYPGDILCLWLKHSDEGRP